jgi:hypothetical protein
VPTRKLIVELIGDSRSLERAFGRTSAGAHKVNAELSKVERGVLAGSGVFRGFGRSLAFASGGFLAFGGAAAFLRKSVDAAIEAQVAQRQLATQLRNNGDSFASYRHEIDETVLHLSALSGFQNDELLTGLTTILRTVPNVDKALRDLSTAADLARARHIGLAQASLVIAKTEAGNTTLLRRQGFQIAKNATVEEALAALRQKIAGQAAAGTTEQERFGAVLHDTEEVIGTGLLPSLNRYLAAGTKWMQQMQESGSLQRNVETIARDVTTAIDETARAVRIVDRVTGGFAKTLELLLALKVARVVGGWASGFVTLAAAESTAATAVATSRTASGIPNLDMRAASATQSTDRLAASSAKLGRALGTTGLAAQVGVLSFALTTFALRATGGDDALRRVGRRLSDLAQHSRGLRTDLGAIGLGGESQAKFRGGSTAGDKPGTIAGQSVQQVIIASRQLLDRGRDADQVLVALQRRFTTMSEGDLQVLLRIAQKVQDTYRSVGGAAAEASAKAAHGIALAQAAAQQTGGGDDTAPGLKLTVAQRRTFFDNAIARILMRGGLGSIRQQIAAFDQAEKLIAARIAKTKDVTRQLALEDELLQVQSQERGVRQQQRADALAKRAAEADARRTREQTHLFALLGLGPGGEARVPRVANLQKRLAQLRENIAGTTFDTPRMTSRLNQIGRALTNALLPKHGEVRQRIAELLDTISGELQKAPKQYTKWGQPSTSALMRGLGLDANQSRILRKRLALLGHGGTTAPGSSQAFAGQTTVVHAHTYIDGREVSKTVTKQQQKDSTRRGQSRRGPYAGRH